MENVERLFIPPESSIQDAIACIDANELGIALVVDADQHLVGTIVDGDIRRAILAQIPLDSPITTLLARKEAIYQTSVTAPANTEKAQLIKLMKDRQVRHVPLVENGRVVDLFHMRDVLDLEDATLPIQAVVMAGGFGTRLRPLTDDLPKPMLPVGDQPLMEHVIKQLRRAGVREINVTTHYLPEKIKDHFGDGSGFGVHLNYVTEERPLGTAGGVGLIATPDTPLLVINGDLLTDINFEEMYEFHREQKAALTVAVRIYEFTVPYGVIETQEGYVSRLVEKPSYKFFVNAGIYLLEPSAFRLIPKQQHINMTDVIDRLIAEGQSVASFPVREYWLDIGQHADYLQAQEDIKDGKVKS